MQKCIYIALTALLMTASVRAEPPVNSAEPATVLDEVLVSGEQPGPGMWKVTKSDHTLWILGSYTPLPKKMSWRSKDAEEAIAQSQELLAAASVKADIGFFKGLMLLPSLIGVRNNPDDKKLKDVLPADLYSRWLVLKEKYIGSDSSVEKWRPIFAAQELYAKAINKAGLSTKNSVWPVIEKIAKKNKLEFVAPTVNLDINKPRAVIKEFKKTPLDDIECFAKTMRWLEADLGAMRAQANAWATGDVKALRTMNRADAATTCIAAVMNMQVVQERGYQDVPERVANEWVAAAKSALARNKSTFAVLSIDEILKPDGYVAKLQSQGYSVQEP